MILPTVVEQQAKLGVSAEESKAQRIKRQQARFRDRGGAFIPSTSNPLVDILLARTVSGESPSKTRSNNVAAKRFSPSKARQVSHKVGTTTVTEESQAVPGSSKPKLPASRKGKTTSNKSEVDKATRSPKRRGTKKGKKKIAGPDSDTNQQLPADAGSKRTSKGKGKQRAAPSTLDGNPRAKAKTKSKSNPAKQVVEVLVSDDDQTLVEVPRKVKPNARKNIPPADDGETDDDAPIVRKRVISRVDDSKASSTKTATPIRMERKKTLEERTQDENCPKTIAKKRLVLHDDEDDNVAAPPSKKGRVADSTSAKSKTIPDPEPAPCLAKSTKSGGKPRGTGKGKGKGNAELAQSIVEPVEGDENERPFEREVSKPQKRKKEDGNYDDRPRKVVKFTETSAPHSSSQKLKENQPDRKHDSGIKPRVEDELDAPPKSATKPPSRAKTPKGPPREVLERIKASAARHLRCVDSEPDELDCLS